MRFLDNLVVVYFLGPHLNGDAIALLIIRATMHGLYVRQYQGWLSSNMTKRSCTCSYVELSSGLQIRSIFLWRILMQWIYIRTCTPSPSERQCGLLFSAWCNSATNNIYFILIHELLINCYTS